MLLQSIAFWLLAVTVIASALMVITSRNPVHSVLFLILTFFVSSGLLVLLGAYHVGATKSGWGVPRNGFCSSTTFWRKRNAPNKHEPSRISFGNAKSSDWRRIRDGQRDFYPCHVGDEEVRSRLSFFQRGPIEELQILLKFEIFGKSEDRGAGSRFCAFTVKSQSASWLCVGYSYSAGERTSATTSRLVSPSSSQP